MLVTFMDQTQYDMKAKIVHLIFRKDSEFVCLLNTKTLGGPILKKIMNN